ncbi:MAG: hypothetical protein IT434_12615 [Phycisphaerales bacterium]|jgi:hypothetical protein|nr:hypothetical protein [Phycisphaerales bacterium]
MPLSQLPIWLVSTLGWSGTILIFSAFLFKDRFPRKLLAVMNITGSVLFGVSLVARESYEGLFLQVAWIIVAIVDYRRAMKSPPNAGA